MDWSDQFVGLMGGWTNWKFLNKIDLPPWHCWCCIDANQCQRLRLLSDTRRKKNQSDFKDDSKKEHHNSAHGRSELTEHTFESRILTIDVEHWRPPGVLHQYPSQGHGHDCPRVGSLGGVRHKEKSSNVASLEFTQATNKCPVSADTNKSVWRDKNITTKGCCS